MGSAHEEATFLRKATNDPTTPDFCDTDIACLLPIQNRSKSISPRARVWISSGRMAIFRATRSPICVMPVRARSARKSARRVAANPANQLSQSPASCQCSGLRLNRSLPNRLASMRSNSNGTTDTNWAFIHGNGCAGFALATSARRAQAKKSRTDYKAFGSPVLSALR